MTLTSGDRDLGIKSKTFRHFSLVCLQNCANLCRNQCASVDVRSYSSYANEQIVSNIKDLVKFSFWNDNVKELLNVFVDWRLLLR